MMTRVYQYGLLPPDQNHHLVREQMRLAHRYYNDLIAIERGRRAAEREVLGSNRGLQWLTWAAEFWQEEVIRATRAIKASRASTRSRSETTAMREDHARAKRESTKARKTLAFGLALVRASTKMTELFERQGELKKSARAHSSVYWGTYLLAEGRREERLRYPWRTRCRCRSHQHDAPLRRVRSGSRRRRSGNGHARLHKRPRRRSGSQRES
jgi:hypothetical protein